MPHKIFEIDEIFRPIAGHVVDLSGSSAIALACCCKAFEEPVLSSYWEEQSLDKLARVIPTGVLKRSGLNRSSYYVCTPEGSKVAKESSLTCAVLQTTTRLPTQEERDRLLRYAFWIKRITCVITRRFEAFFKILQLSSPTETPFPNLRGLTLWIYPPLLRFLPLFVSSRMSTFSISVYRDTPFDPKTVERDYLAAVVAALPTSLREFTLRIDHAGLGSGELKEEVLLMIRRCGQTLVYLKIDVELPAVTIQRVMRLPNLRTWEVHRSLLPATLTSCSEATYLPALRSLALSATNTYDWVIFLTSSYPTVDAVRSTLTELNLNDHCAVDPILIAQICVFTNLTRLEVGWSCPEDRCTFALADDDLSRLSLTLPRLEWLTLGHQCDKNTCRTTFRSLLFLSARCPRLTSILIHFNTMQITQDIRSLFETTNPGIKELWDSPTRCQIETFSVFETPLSLKGSDELDVVKRGFLNVFPRLRNIARRCGRTWQCLTEALEK
ncbi:hypothetical protein BDM02DRAFT_3183860 [Thelephora ganbajun]|uniref:Uncharacterized protein n=1 Tax=Thelephora ganbajun TaxID=370292 RepID=A0ACB6ZRK7_THEGA|nr:hypothetical protein BDM02DRAFT_3183860 [Thelephora ganbajun]